MTDLAEPPPPETVQLRAHPGAVALACPLVWRRSARARLVALRLDAGSGAVVITLPPEGTRRAGLALLRRHAGWVAGRLAALGPGLPLAAGAVLPVGDLPHRVLHDPGQDGPARIEGARILVGGAADTVAQQLRDLLLDEADRRIRPKLRQHAESLGVVPGPVRLKDTRTRWASCAPDGTLAFSWRLVMAPDWVLDYVVAHEVAHLRELNHSARFWAALQRLSPHHEAAQQWLREHGPGLLRIG
ncbi:M48 family metallopeptidase [Roseomonas sp. 18066]|uniref:M48 family metallopeptidase n=1 Tax=Roseomonas sp. 18066 TaxID=2681412 RepID=UPI001F38592D|nr:SprT family zinc-dependent metalloprotease [Roseomonas sp. 18066]